MEQSDVYRITALREGGMELVYATAVSHGRTLVVQVPAGVPVSDISIGDAIYVAFFKQGEDPSVDEELLVSDLNKEAA